MKTRAIAAAMLLATSGSGFAASSPARMVFDEIAALVGDWRSADPAKGTRVTYSLTANGTTILEAWTMSPTRQSLTVYTMDGDRLLATHYCPQGNAPRLAYRATDADGTHRFDFLDGANLQAPDGWHEHAFRLRLAPDRVVRSETYLRNDATLDATTEEGALETFVRAD